ncbi:MGH1-like glycoside hydrolase domain-containing protein [Actinoplanes sp. CA-051413]|uniref:MGH1-like glycoside hydrolase domain-containing protein n=1 Tax=Actinoplanes sp. CA-051413 TaxID=3239899 RepID=UPI003D952504
MAAVTVLASGAAVTAVADPARAAQTIGYPVFTGAAIPQPPVGYTTGNMMQSIYDSEKAGTDFWMDRLLSRSGGDDPSDADGGILMTRGRAVFMKQHNPAVIGFGGRVAYWESINDANAYAITLSPGTFSEQPAQRRQAPSYWRSVYAGGSLQATETKFITDNNVLVTNLAIKNNGSASSTLTVRATSPYASSGSGNELTGSTGVKNGLTTLTTKLSGDGFSVSSGGLNRSITVGAGQTVQTKVVMGFIAKEIPESATDYATYRDATPDTAFATHVRLYNKWWADNVPYIDVPEPAIKKEVYYRWWLMRFNNLDANIPGQNFQFPTSVEGVLGYNNAIALTQPMHIDDLKYLRDPKYSYGDWLSVGQISKGGRFLDNPGDPENWSNSYIQYIAEAAWRSYQLHGGQPAIAARLAHYAEGDVKGQLSTYDSNNNGIIEYNWGAMTGNDADAVSFDYAPGSNLDRAEGAYQYSGAMAAAQAYDAAGNSAKATEMRSIADRIRNAIVGTLWNPGDNLLEHKVVPTNQFNPWKEINNYYPYAVGLMPDTDQYKQALRLFADPAEYPVFPFYTANQKDKAAAAAKGNPGSNNFSTINSTVQFRLLSSVLRKYPNQWISADDYKKLLYWNTWAQYVNGNTAWPDANEFWADWNPATKHIDYRSWIHHNILGSSNWTIIEDVAGLRQRNDNKVELSPITIGWPNFAVNNLRYRNADLSIVWDDPADGVVRYPGVPEGYSIFINGNRVATVNKLVPLVWDPATGSVTTTATVTFSTAVTGLQAPNQVTFSDAGTVDLLAKAGVDLTPGTANLASGVAVSTSFTASGATAAAAADGYPTNEPFWGAAGSPNSQDWYELNFGSAKTVDEMRLYFKDSRPASTAYRAPASYTVQYYNGSAWVDAAGQVKTPAAPQGNLNKVQFTPVSTQRLRVLVTHASGSKAGLTEVQAFNRGGGTPPPPTGTSYEAEASGNALAGQAAIRTSPGASGGSLVGYVGNGAANYLQVNNVAGTAGSHSITVYYASADDRSTQVSVNGGGPVSLATPSTGGFDTVGAVSLTVTLAAGTNTIRFSNTTGWSPDFDRIVVN